MPHFRKLEFGLLREGMTQVLEHGPRLGERQEKKGGLYDGHCGQPVVYAEATRRPSRFHLFVKCLPGFEFGPYPDAEVRCLMNDGRLFVGYITKSSADQSVFFRASDSQLLAESDFIAATVVSKVAWTDDGTGPIGFHFEVRRGRRIFGGQNNAPGNSSNVTFERPHYLRECRARAAIRCTIIVEDRASLMRKGVFKSLRTTTTSFVADLHLENVLSAIPQASNELNATAESTLISRRVPTHIDAAASKGLHGTGTTFMAGLPLPTHTESTSRLVGLRAPPAPMLKIAETITNAAKRRRLPNTAAPEVLSNKSSRMGSTASMYRRSIQANHAKGDGTTQPRGKRPTFPSEVIEIDDDDDGDGDDSLNSNSGHATLGVGDDAATSNGQQLFIKTEDTSAHPKQPVRHGSAMHHTWQDNHAHHLNVYTSAASESQTTHPPTLVDSKPIVITEQEFLSSSPVSHPRAKATPAISAKADHTSELALVKLHLEEASAMTEEASARRKECSLKLKVAELHAQMQ